MCFLLNLGYCVKSYGHLLRNFGFFIVPAHQIWSCPVTQDAISKIFYFCPNSTFNIRKSHQISSGKRSLLQKLKNVMEVENTPLAAMSP